MDVAIHYNADHPTLGCHYGPPIYSSIFAALLDCVSEDTDSEVRVGDVPFHSMQSRAIQLWIGSKCWRQLLADVEFLQSHNIFVVTLSRVTMALATRLDHLLRADDAYLGMIEIDETIQTHVGLYRLMLCPFGHVLRRKFFLYWDGIMDDSKDSGMLEFIRELPFEEVDYEVKHPFEN